MIIFWKNYNSNHNCAIGVKKPTYSDFHENPKKKYSKSSSQTRKIQYYWTNDKINEREISFLRLSVSFR